MNPEAIARLQEIYQSLPKINCQQKCQACCTIITLSPIEIEHLKQNGKGLPVARYSKEFDYQMCSHLRQNGDCAIQPVKPLICRLWGLTETMVCPHGCEPERRLTREEMLDLMLEVDALRSGSGYCNKDGWKG
ncbi:YkgJ family cysteine cluster protein [Pantanalinema sp. GBBB05]|uniref:YkgJ family cysteine cluster protein n=1 Tax=Pantanalinema sp. GBBB05 TaxID=2604139 RepID=UPI001D60EEB4|nr:hypothetical protein [Pantanalinema sp. GBBB05]